MPEKHPETLETQHRSAAMTYPVGNCGGTGPLDGACPLTPAMPAVGRWRGDAAGSGEGAADRGRGGSAAFLSPRGRVPTACLSPPTRFGGTQGRVMAAMEWGGGDTMEAIRLEGRRTCSQL
jgi:hypothetical protein